jgi:lipoprotein-anchoring transpeptidase ErfK/SrfK
MHFCKGDGLQSINMPTEEAEWLFGWADVGTLVNVRE